MKGLMVLGVVVLALIGVFLISGFFVKSENSGIVNEIASRLQVENDDNDEESNVNSGSSVSGGSGNSLSSFGLNCEEVQIAYSLGSFLMYENCLDDSCNTKEVECKATLKNLDYDSYGNFQVGIYIVNSTNDIENPIDSVSLIQEILPREEYIFSNIFFISGNQEIECKSKTISIPKKESC